MATPIQEYLQMAREHKNILMRAIGAGAAEKKRVYIPGAKACYQFYLGEYKHLFKQDRVQAVDNNFMTVNNEVADKPLRVPIFQMADNVVAQFVQIYSPYLQQGEMVRTVKPSKPYEPPPAAYGIHPQELQQMMAMNPDRNQATMYMQQQMQAMQQMQMDQMMAGMDMQLRTCRSEMIERLLNYYPKELNHREERKYVVDESLVVGGGVYMTELVTMPTSDMMMIASNFVSMNDIIWDPDAQRIKDCKWLAVQYRAPAWMVAKMFNIPEEDIKPSATSMVGLSVADNINLRNRGKQPNSGGSTEDEIVFWKFWSRMGCGAKFENYRVRNPVLVDLDNILGDNCFFIVSDSVEYPLNFGPKIHMAAQELEVNNQQIQMQYEWQNQIAAQAGLPQMPPPQTQSVEQLLQAACAWPIPFHLEPDDPFPVTTLSYHTRPASPYPVPHLEFCLSYINFMSWVFCFVADKCYRSQRTFWLIDESIADQIIEAITKGQDEAIVRLRELGKMAKGELDKFIQFIDAPEVKASIFDVYEFFNDKFQRASGLSDLMQAKMARASRSATEARNIADASTLRPQAMAEEVYHVDTKVARKEAIAALMYLQPKDIAPILGQPAGHVWQNLIMTRSVEDLMRETEYDVVASPGRVLDLNARQDQSNQMAQIVLPLLTQIGQATGMFGPANAILTEWAKANQIDPALVQLPEFLPPPAEAAPPKGQASPPKQPAKKEG